MPSPQPHALFATIQREHLGLVARVAHAFAREPADRDELFQDILVAIWQALPQFQEGARLTTYVYRVAFNCALNWRRTRSRYQRRIDAYAQVAADPTAGMPPRARAQLEWLYTQINALPPLDRTVILLSLDRVDYTSIAEITGLSESNVGVRLHRIKQHLAAAAATLSHEL